MRKLGAFGLLAAAILAIVLTATSGCGNGYGGGGGSMYPTPSGTMATPMHT